MSTPDDMVRILQDLPARYPKLISLVWELLDDDGNLDPEKAILRAREVAEAVNEAEYLKRENGELMKALVRLCREDR